ncbi:MAG TPA: hypothetical protein VG323_22760 [Thermoanaerobaculia bacterium]|nr:hypothetical protein [Thermoanaerobaculia bacterium]
MHREKQPRLAIRKARPEPPETAYFQPIALQYALTNISAEPLLIDSVTLQFQPDMDTAPVYVDATFGFRLVPNETRVIDVEVTPTPEFLDATNEIQIRVKYHLESEDGRFIAATPERHKQGYYVIIRKPARNLGDVFISFKQMEDLRFANILERYLKRAGFKPHLFIREPNVGAHQWITIENILKTCHSAFIVWTDKTDFGEGVQTEIRICRRLGVREIPLLERGLDVPSCFDSRRTYLRFDPQQPAAEFSEAVASLRTQILETSAPHGK